MIGDMLDEVEARRTIQSPHPSQLKNARVSLRGVEDMMAEMTADSARSGACVEHEEEGSNYSMD